MKHITFVFIALCLIVSNIPAQPAKIYLQSVLRDSTGSLLTGYYSIRVRIFKDSTGGLPIYTSPQSQAYAEGGLMKVNADVYDIDEAETQNTSFGQGMYQLWWEMEVEGQVLLPRIASGFVTHAIRAWKTIGPGSIASATGASAGGTNNRARGLYSAVLSGGGPMISDSNSVRDTGSVIAGGAQNLIGGSYSFIGGGRNNYQGDLAEFSVIGGGQNNYQGDLAEFSVIGGGRNNYMGAGADQEEFSVIGGGENNTVHSSHSFIGGGRNGFIGAGPDNEDFSAIVGGENNAVYGNHSYIGGGRNCLVGGGNTTVYSSLIVGGDSNSIVGGGTPISVTGSLIVGGQNNSLAGSTTTLDVTGSLIVGGENNSVRGSYSLIGGGRGNVTYSGATNSVIVGGESNSVFDLAVDGFIGGGLSNRVGGLHGVSVGGHDNDCDAMSGVVTGGDSNLVTMLGSYGFIGGGLRNKVNGTHGTVSGGTENECSGGTAGVVAGGEDCVAQNDHSAVGGGLGNIASGVQATVPGGAFNAARGRFSVALGNRAKANHDGSVVISANDGITGSDSIASGGTQQMVLRADGGVYVTNASGTAAYDATKLINTSSGAYLTTSGTWTNSSDRNRKKNFTPVDGKELLEKLEKLPITTWNYKSESTDVKHIGPVAQDFYELFHLGSDHTSISTIDPAGVALAAIQQLSRQNQDLTAQNQELAARLAKLEGLVKSLADEKEGGNTSMGEAR